MKLISLRPFIGVIYFIDKDHSGPSCTTKTRPSHRCHSRSCTAAGRIQASIDARDWLRLNRGATMVSKVFIVSKTWYIHIYTHMFLPFWLIITIMEWFLFVYMNICDYIYIYLSTVYVYVHIRTVYTIVSNWEINEYTTCIHKDSRSRYTYEFKLFFNLSISYSTCSGRVITWDPSQSMGLVHLQYLAGCLNGPFLVHFCRRYAVFQNKALKDMGCLSSVQSASTKSEGDFRSTKPAKKNRKRFHFCRALP